MKELEKVNKDPKFIEYMSAEEDQRKRENTMIYNAKEEGKELGKAEGIKEEKREVAVNLYKEGVDINTISNATGLSLEEIEELIKKDENNLKVE